MDLTCFTKKRKRKKQTLLLWELIFLFLNKCPAFVKESKYYKCKKNKKQFEERTLLFTLFVTFYKLISTHKSTSAKTFIHTHTEIKNFNILRCEFTSIMKINFFNQSMK